MNRLRDSLLGHIHSFAQEGDRDFLARPQRSDGGNEGQGALRRIIRRVVGD